MARQQAGDLPRLVERRPRQDRVRVEVDEPHAAAPLHEAAGGDRRVDSAGQQAEHGAAGAGRQPALARLLAQRVEHAVREYLDADGEIRGAEVHPPAPRRLDPAAHLALHPRRRQRIRLVRPADPDPEARDAGRAGVGFVEMPHDRAGDLLDPASRAPGAREVRHAEDPAEALAHRGPFGRRAQAHLDPPHERAHVRDVQVRRRGAQAAREAVDEPGTVPPLERDLVVVDDDRFHRT